MSDYTPKEGDIMADDWVIPADGTPPFRIVLSNNDYDQLRNALDNE